jgi:DNA polymerase-3 subunit chi
VASESEAKALDQLLWEDDESFIPHGIDQGDLPKAPVGIGWQDPPDRHSVLVNLGGPLPSWFSHFDHLVEIVVQEATVLETTRANWKQLKFDGYPITQHDLRS